MSRTRVAVGGSGESDATEAVAVGAAAAASAVVKRREVQDLRLRLTRERRSPVRELGHRTRSRRRRRVWVEAGTCLVKGEEEEERGKRVRWREIQDSRGGATKKTGWRKIRGKCARRWKPQWNWKRALGKEE
jgi:hypothetical protein